MFIVKSEFIYLAEREKSMASVLDNKYGRFFMILGIQYLYENYIKKRKD